MKLEDPKREEAFKALEDRSFAFNHDQTGIILYKTTEFEIIRNIEFIEKVTRSISESSEDLFAITDRSTKNKPRNTRRTTKEIRTNNLGNKLITSLKRAFSLNETHLEMQEASPYFSTFYQKAKEKNLYRLLRKDYATTDDEKTRFVEQINEFINSLREEINSSSFVSKLKKRNRSANKNSLALSRYIDALFAKHSRLLVIRIDLSYKKDLPSKAFPIEKQYEEVKRHRVDFFRKMRSHDKLFKNLKGFAWKLEYGYQKGFHYHILLFFDGARSREDISLAQAIGEYWTGIITKGNGLYYNCNAIKERYKSRGIGMINHYDKDLIENLRKAVVTYMTKIDAYLRIITPKKDKSFGKGNMPVILHTQGRPRRQSS